MIPRVLVFPFSPFHAWFSQRLRRSGARVFSCALLPVTPAAATATAAETRLAGSDYWLDLVSAEETDPETVLTDLASAQVVYVGEAHTIDRRHAIQLELLRALADRGLPLALCLEQIEAKHQPAVDRFNAGELDFDALAREINWSGSWATMPITVLSWNSPASAVCPSASSMLPTR